MNQQQLQARLQARLDELQQRLDKLTHDATSAHSADSAEQAQERENDEVIDNIGNETRMSIIQVQHALEQLEAGNYGFCQSCGEPISEGRLAAIPEATHCVNCAD